MSLHHSFDIDIANKYGINVAIFLNNLAHWTDINICNNHNFYDGAYWSYNTHEALLAIFSYWSKKTLRTTIERCITEGLINKGNYNKTSMDRTIWYSLTDKGIALFPTIESKKNTICRKRQIEMPESANPVAGNGTAIPDTNTDTNTDIKSSCRSAPKKIKSQDQKQKRLAPQSGVSGSVEKSATATATKHKTRSDYREENEKKHHWHSNAKVSEPITEDPTICNSCKRHSHEGACSENGLLPKEIRKMFSAEALKRTKSIKIVA